MTAFILLYITQFLHSFKFYMHAKFNIQNYTNAYCVCNIPERNDTKLIYH